MIYSDLVGDAHLEAPFSIGRIDAARPYVHVFDEMSLHCVMSEIDTAPDFVEYLTRREALLTNPDRIIIAPGEEELLASYLTHVDATGEHSFLSDGEGEGLDGIAFGEGGWNAYLTHEQRKAKITANNISYLWDRLVEHLIAELHDHPSQQPVVDPALVNREMALRAMASETRFRRRFYARHLIEVIERSRGLPPLRSFVRVGFIRERPDLAYVFLALGLDSLRPREEYELARNNMLAAYCNVLSLELPEAREIVGLAMTPAGITPANEALFFMKTGGQSEESRTETRLLQAELNILVGFRQRVLVDHQTEYPGG